MKKEKERKFCSHNSKALGKMQPDAKLHLKVLSGLSFFLSSQRRQDIGTCSNFPFSAQINKFSGKRGSFFPVKLQDSLGLRHCVLRLISEPIAETEDPGYADYLITPLEPGLELHPRHRRGSSKEIKRKRERMLGIKITNTYPGP